MSGRDGIQRPGAFETAPGVLSELDHAFAMLAAAHWIGRFKNVGVGEERAQYPAGEMGDAREQDELTMMSVALTPARSACNPSIPNRCGGTQLVRSRSP